MKSSLSDHLKLLKSTKKTQIPKVQEKEIIPEVPLKKSNEGIFKKISFCFMTKELSEIKDDNVIRQNDGDEYEDLFRQNDGLISRYHKLIELISKQGGEVLQFGNNKLINVTYLLVDKSVDLETVKMKIAGKVIYSKILCWKYPYQCLKKFRILDISDYEIKSMQSKDKIKKQKNDYKCHKDTNKIYTVSKELTNKKDIEKQESKEFDEEYDQTQPMKKIKMNQIIDPKKQQNNKYTHCLLGQIGSRSKSTIFKQNEAICEELMELQRIYANDGDLRNVAYIRAVSIIKNYPKAIKSDQDVDRIKGLGRRIQSKIKELLLTGGIEKLKRLQRNQNKITTLELSKVWGVGSKKAEQLYHKGIKTVEQLRQRPQLLTKNQKIGLKYHQQFQNRIPYDKVSRMFEIVKTNFYKTVKSQIAHKIEVTGSFRRGKSTCGDMDVIITRIDGLVEKKILHNLISKLEEQKFLTDHLSLPKYFQGHTSIAYMGVCYFEGSHHRVDFKCYPVEQYAFALLYFTGSDLFNRQMRMIAHNKGLLLSDHGIKLKERNGVENLWKGGEVPACYTEEAIFKFLELKHKTPEERSI